MKIVISLSETSRSVLSQSLLLNFDKSCVLSLIRSLTVYLSGGGFGRSDLQLILPMFVNVVRETNCPGYGVGDPYYSLSSCFVRYEESINWFLARNKCLLRGGDLATLTNTTDAGIKSLLDTLGYTEPTDKTNGGGKQYWIGLRKIRWNWIPGTFQ